MAKTFDCEPYLRALEEQADSIGGAANGMLQAIAIQRKCGVSSKKCGQLKENDRNDQESNEFGAWG